MKIQIDYREKDLITNINKINKKNISIEICNLPLGDICILDDSNNDIVLIERKTLKDLASSILDGRYKEQSFRLNNYNLCNHNIIYLIEGNIHLYEPNKYGRSISKESLYSAITSIFYSKGFSIYKSINLEESAEFILQMTEKLSKIKPSNITDCKDYVEVCNKVKKNNITPNNIFPIMLSQIPGVSQQSANALSEEFKDIENLIQCLKTDSNVLNDVCTISKDGKKRRLNINCKQNIYNFV